jgi:hypothetical protein
VILEFFGGALQGVAGNLLTRLLDTFWGRASEAIPDEAVNSFVNEVSASLETQAVRRFKTFHIKSGFESVLAATPDPVVHVLVEDKPTTAWHLAILVVESRTTGEWYISSKGEMALEGSGGGLAVSKMVASMCRTKQVPVAGWVCSQLLSNQLARGLTLWPTAKAELLPLVTYAESDYFAKYIATTFREIHA